MNPKHFSQCKEGKKVEWQTGKVSWVTTASYKASISLWCQNNIYKGISSKFQLRRTQEVYLLLWGFFGREWNRADTYPLQEHYLLFHKGMLFTTHTTLGQYLVPRRDGATVCSFSCPHQQPDERGAKKEEMEICHIATSSFNIRYNILCQAQVMRQSDSFNETYSDYPSGNWTKSWQFCSQIANHTASFFLPNLFISFLF